MNQRGFPLWLLRDVRALVAVMLSFWPLVIFVITNGPKAVRGAAGPRNTISLLLAHAEAWLDYAFMRQAYRLCGFDPRAVTLRIIPPTTRWADTVERFRNYGLAFRNMNRVVASHVDALRVQYGLTRSEVAARCNSPLRFASRSTSPGFAGGGHPPAALAESSLADRRGRWRVASSRRDGGGCPLPRGPPSHISISRLRTSPAPRQRERLTAPIPPSRTARRPTSSARTHKQHP